MSLTRPIPEGCRAIVETIRREVQRPVELPVLKGSGLRWRWKNNECCPMGFLRAARSYTPSRCEELPGFEFQAVEDFAGWWDTQTDAEAAVAAVWGSA